MAAKKKATKKRAAKKKAVKKKAAKKKAAARKTARAGKKAATKKAATRKKKAARKSSRTKRASAADETEAPAAEAEVDAPAPTQAAPGRPAAGGLRRGVRRKVRRPRTTPSGAAGDAAAPEIPPLPEDDDFVPAYPGSDGEQDTGGGAGGRNRGGRGRRGRQSRGRRAADDAAAREILERVRRGEEHISALAHLSDEDVRRLATQEGVKTRDGDRASDILYRLVSKGEGPRERTQERDAVQVEGLLELHPDGYGFLRRTERNYSQHPEDVYVAAGLVRRLGLQPGHWIVGHAHRPRPGQAYLALQTIEEVNHESPEKLASITPFKDLTVVFPDTRIVLETGSDDLEMRIMDLFCPLGRGQRGLIVAPPRSGKTVLLTKLADAIATNSPDVDIVVLLVDERPEEVTNMRRSVRGEVIASTFDKPATNHIRVAELVMDKVKRMVEYGRNVVLLLDSITRLGRAYNNQTGGSGRILSGGLDANALTKPKRFFGSARNVEDGGSLTIVASALVDTGSKLDQVIFEEFKGTGNMEVVLSRDLANARVWPAIDVPASGTRNEDLLLHPDELQRVVMLRRGITGQDPIEVMTVLRRELGKHQTNGQFLMSLGEG